MPLEAGGEAERGGGGGCGLTDLLNIYEEEQEEEVEEGESDAESEAGPEADSDEEDRIEEAGRAAAEPAEEIKECPD